MSSEKGTEESSTGQESALVESVPTTALVTPSATATAVAQEQEGSSSSSSALVLDSASPRKRKRLKKDSDGFSEHYLAQYGLSVAQGPETSLTSIRVLECRFCRVFGRESAPGRIRAVSRKVHQWKGPFKTHNFTIHLTVCHAEKWQLYKSLESEQAKEAFFDVDHSQLLAIANAAAAAAESRDLDATAEDSALLLLSNNGLPALNSNTKDAHQSAKRLKYLSAATAAVASQAAGDTSHTLNTDKSAYPVRTIRFQRGTRTLDMMHEMRNNPNETMQTLVRRAKQDDLMNVFDATRNHGKNRGRNHPPKHLFFSIDGVGSFSEAVFLRTPIHGIFSLSTENPLIVELEYRVMEDSSSEDEGGEEDDEDVADNDYAEQLAAAAAAVGSIRQTSISPQQQLQPQPQAQQQQPQFLLQQPLPQQQPRYSAYPHQYTRTGFWMH
jgi:hypothetical protein